MSATKFTLGCSALALVGSMLPCSPVFAQETEFGTDVLAGIVRNERDAADDKKFSGGALPSFHLRGGKFAAQADGMLFEHAGDTGTGGAVHLGAALGERGFIGVYGSISELGRAGGLTTKRLGGEIKVASGPLWFSGIVGHEDAERKTVFINTTTTHDVYDVYGEGRSLFAFADVGWAPSANAALSVGFRRTGGRSAAAATAAFGLSPKLSLMFQGRAGRGDYQGVFAGLRLRFGGRANGKPSKLLENRLIEDLFTAGNSRRRLLDPLPPPPPLPDDDDDCGSCGGYCAA